MKKVSIIIRCEVDMDIDKLTSLCNAHEIEFSGIGHATNLFQSSDRGFELTIDQYGILTIN